MVNSTEMIRVGYAEARRVPIRDDGSFRRIIAEGYEPIEVTTYGDNARRYVPGLDSR